MKLPNAENAWIDMEKLTAYCLNPEHERGKHKAIVFESACSITNKNADLLRQALLDGAIQGEATLQSTDDYAPSLCGRMVCGRSDGKSHFSLLMDCQA